MNFLNSPVVNKFINEGTLPTIEIALDQSTLLDLFAGLLILVLIILLGIKFFL